MFLFYFNIVSYGSWKEAEQRLLFLAGLYIHIESISTGCLSKKNKAFNYDIRHWKPGLYGSWQYLLVFHTYGWSRVRVSNGRLTTDDRKSNSKDSK